ncbi:MAG TPA: competence/damage-inducible protein A [Lachnospiraceae bacterium]|nr:competence/damage-inducible protein A [Lachnospiraceae bacterium]
MNVELISVGTELLLGNIVNTNAAYLSKKCAELGLSSYYQVTVGDNKKRLISVLKECYKRSDIIILTGGLGPTEDDITKETVAEVVNRELVPDEESKKRIQSYFDFRNTSSDASGISANNWKQALKIEGSIVIANDNGTAPGYIVEVTDPGSLDLSGGKGKRIILLPGPPSEMIPMFEKSIFPYLKQLQDTVFVSKMVKICGIGESKAETMILDLIEGQSNPTIAPYAKSGEVHFRVTASAKDTEKANRMLEPILDELKKRFENHIYTMNEDETLEEVVVKLLHQKNLTLATAESCTGGLFTGRIVNVAGVSDVLKEGYITYSNESKMHLLGVKKETLETFGAVSEQTAREMAVGAAKAAGTDTAVAITGIAGPDGGTPLKPVGLVYVSCYVKGNVEVKECHFRGDRQKVREQTVIQALDLLRRNL